MAAGDTDIADAPGRIVVITAVYAVIVVVVDLLTPDDVHFHAGLVAVPALMSLTCRVGWTAWSGVAAGVVENALHLDEDHGPRGFVRNLAIVYAMIVVTVVCCLTVRARLRHFAMLTQVRSVAEVAQSALLRAVPLRLHGMRFGVRYMAAAAEARIGGDLYEVLDTPFGVRVIIGDVRGKGLGAVGVAAVALGAFREAAYSRRRLAGIGAALEESLCRHLCEEDFVTAAIVEFPHGGGMRVAVFGHPPPLLARAGEVSAVQCPEGVELPLGLGMLHSRPRRAGRLPLLPFGPGDRLLLYTDGAAEARDGQGRFFDVAAALSLCAGGLSPDAILDEVYHALVRHVGGSLQDDVALLLVSAPAEHGETTPGVAVLSRGQSGPGEP